MKNFHRTLCETSCLEPLCKHATYCLLSEIRQKQHGNVTSAQLIANDFLKPDLRIEIKPSLYRGSEDKIQGHVICYTFEEIRRTKSNGSG